MIYGLQGEPVVLCPKGDPLENNLLHADRELTFEIFKQNFIT